MPSGNLDGFLIKKQIELKNGKTQKFSHPSYQKNSIEYYRYNGWSGIIYFINDAILYWENLMIVPFLAIHTVAENQIELTYFYPIILLVLNIIVAGIVNLIIDWKLKQACKVINKKEVSKFIVAKKTKQFETRTWASLMPGDIIKIKENEEFPADVLILDVNTQYNDHKCYIRGGFIDDFSIPSLKKSCEGTQNKTPGIKMPATQFVDQISGQVKYEYNYSGFFSGTYKLNNNPAAFNLSTENIAVRGSYLSQTKSAICLVLNVGSDCMGSIFKGSKYRGQISKNSKLSIFKSKKNHDRFYNEMRIFQITMIFVYILIAFIVQFQGRFSNEQQKHKFMEKILQFYTDKGNESKNSLFVKEILAFISVLFVSLPLSYKLVMDIIVLVHSNFVEWDYNTVPANLKFNQGISMKALGSISNVFLSKSSIMGHNVKKAKILQIKRTQYFDQSDEKTRMSSSGLHIPKLTNRNSIPSPQLLQTSAFKNYTYPQQLPYRRPQDDSSNYSQHDHYNVLTPSQQQEEDENVETIDDYLPNTFQFQPTFINSQLNHDLLYSSQNKEQIIDFMRAATMCHQAIRRKEPSPYSKSLYKSIYANEQAQLMLAHSSGFEFINKNNKTITINCQGNRERNDVIVVQDFLHCEQHITVIVIKPFQTQNSGSTIYVKGPLSSMLDFVNETAYDQHKYLRDLKKYTQMGVNPIMFAKKNLNNDETHDLEAKINEAMSLVKEQESKIETSLLYYMNDLTSLGIIGVQEIFNVRDCLTIQDLIKNGVKVWMLSKEDEVTQIINCNAMKLLHKNTNPFVINGETEKDVEEQIKNNLKLLTQGSDQGIKQNQKIRFQSNQSLNFEQESESPKSKTTNTDKKVLLISGNSLKYIFRDESLLKFFLTLAMFSDFIVGSSVTSQQKSELLKYVKQFSKDGTFSMAIIGASEDQNLILEADVSIALNVRFQQSDTLITSDIVMNDIYPLTYLLFKHGTQCHRRLQKTTSLIIYRTFLLGLIFLYYMCINSYSASIPFKNSMLLIFIWVVSQVQLVLVGISYRDVGYDYLFRIFGEYKKNFVITIFNRYDICYLLALALFDFTVFHLISWQNDYPVTNNHGLQFSNDGFQLYYGIILYIIFTMQITNTNEIVRNFHIIFVLLNVIGIMFVLDDEHLISLKQFFKCPSAILYMVLVLIICYIRNYSFDVMRKLLLPSSRKRVEFYSDVEDRLYLEEYEDPDQEFSLEQFKEDYNEVQKRLCSKKITIVNQNMMKLQRSDSLDLIIEKLNEFHSGRSLKKFHDSSILNWFSLSFNDQAKETEYLDSRLKDKIHKFRKILIITIIVNCGQLIKEIILSSLDYLPFDSFYFFLGFILIALILLIFTYKLPQKLNLINMIFFLVLGIFYSFSYYYMYLIEFSMFMTISFFIFSMHGTCVRMVIAVVIGIYILDVNLVNSLYKTIQGDHHFTNQEYKSQAVFPYLSIIWFLFIALWSLYIYWDEKSRKLEFWYGFKKIKEFSKLKSILHILMPAFVRERIRQGQRFIADDQGEVTLIFCDIADFDKIVQMFSGRELIEWLDHIYNAFDQLCEQHALQKIETVGKTYMACGGLKECEKKFDQRLLNKHHAERITEFAFNMIGFLKTQRLKDGTPVKVKIGIHSGQVISGVVGEFKPQFSLIGDTVNKTSRVCANSQPNRILTSKEAHQHLENNSNMFYFDHVSIFLRGIGQENAYYVHKQRGNNALQLQKNRNLINKRDRASSFQAQTQKIGTQKQNTGYGNSNKISPLPNRNYNNFENQDPALVQDTSRSLMNSEKYSENIDPLELLNQSSDSEHFGEDDSFRGDYNYYNFGEFKDDRQIYKNPVENSSYNLVERPNYLLQFNHNQIQLEDQFRMQFFRNNYWKKKVFFTAFVIFNKLELAFFMIQQDDSRDWRKYFLYVYCPILLIFEIIIYLKWRFLKPDNVNLMCYLVTIYFSLMMIATSLQSLGIDHNSRLIQIYLVELMITFSIVFFLGLVQLKQSLIIYFSGFISWIIVICISWNHLSLQSYTFLFELLYFITMHIYMYHNMEMLKRKTNNREKIIDIEIKKTNDLLSNLVPPPVLQGIKNDQKVVDELEDVTLLFTDMVKFTNFSNNVKNPKEVVKLLSELFTRFDQLCVNNRVYKVHTIGDCYVISGYTGHIPQNERTPQIKAQEAFKVIQTGFEMIDIIQDVRNHSDNPDLAGLDMRIGIHTGKIVAGIIGTKIVRYDIFGADVLIANKMESNGEPGQVVVSEETKKILSMGEPLLYEQLDFVHHKTVEFGAINKTVEAYLTRPREGTIGSESSISMEDDDQNDMLSDDSNQGKQVSSNIANKLEEIQEEEIKDDHNDNL